MMKMMMTDDDDDSTLNMISRMKVLLDISSLLGILSKTQLKIS
jgi:hypothetical protein